MGNYSYFCVSCGEEIKPEQARDKMMVSLSYAALDGAPDALIEKKPTYVSRAELEPLINRTDARGRQYLTLKEYLQYTYRDKVTEAQLDQILEAFFNALEDEDLKEQDKADAEALLPGFDNTAVIQLRDNFPGGICYLNWSINDSKGYLYKLIDKKDAIQKITPFWVCSECKEEILADAFEYRQILIGLLGFVSAGKTCMIAALCHRFVEQGAILMATKSFQVAYKEMLRDYAAGYALEKTQTAGQNAYHPSVLKDNVLWTFVDIPGESFFDEYKQDIDDKTLTGNPKIRMALKCHMYILTADYRIINDPHLRSDAQKSIKHFITYAEAFNPYAVKGAPMVLALTKVDQVEKGMSRSNVPEYCNQDSYPQAYRKELSVIRNMGLTTFVDELAKHNYLFALTCAPYGFPPTPFDSFGVGMQREPVRALQPRNIDMIITWLEKIFGIKGVVYDTENALSDRRDLSTLSRNEGHWDDVLVSMIASMFCNPSGADTQWYLTLGDTPFFKSFKQKRIINNFKKGKIRDTISSKEE